MTRVETLTRDPYAVWARDILRLYPVDRPDEQADARARGTAIHAAFERFAEACPGAMPDDAAAIFADLYLEDLETAGLPHEAMAREAALAAEAADWVADWERGRRDGRAIHVEKKGVRTLDIGQPGRSPSPPGPTASRSRPTAAAISSTTRPAGRRPRRRWTTGFSPQLTLTAADPAARRIRRTFGPSRAT